VARRRIKMPKVSLLATAPSIDEWMSGSSNHKLTSHAHSTSFFQSFSSG
jgi:hypothetical protein